MSKELAKKIADRAHLGGWPPGHSRRIAVALTEAEWRRVVSLVRTSTADIAVAHVLRTMQCDGRVAYLLGLGSESFTLLTEAYARLFGHDVAAFRRTFWMNCAPTPVHTTDDLRLARTLTLQEVADGAYGDDPATRGRARDLLAGQPS